MEKHEKLSFYDKYEKSAAVFNKVVVYLILLIVSFAVLYPLVYVVSAAFSPGNSIASTNIVPFGDGFTIEHFEHLFKNTNYLAWFKNTLIIAASTSVCTIIVTTLSAYTFSRLKNRL